MKSIVVSIGLAVSVVLVDVQTLPAAVTVTNPFQGVTRIYRTETSPRAMNMNIVQIDLNAPGIHFQFSNGGGTRETVRERTADFLNRIDAQIGVNTHFFLPVSNSEPNVYLTGFAASNGTIVSQFDPQPVVTGQAVQNYAIVPFAPALNISQNNVASIITSTTPPGSTSTTPVSMINESGVSIYNAVAGSAQIITNGSVSIPVYSSGPNAILGGLLTSNATYSNNNSWYGLARARTAIGISQDGNTLTLFTVDETGGSAGMPVTEVANLLSSEYGVWNALNLDGGGSTTLALEGIDGVAHIVNASSDSTSGTLGRANGGNFAVFALPVPEPTSVFALFGYVAIALHRRRSRDRASC